MYSQEKIKEAYDGIVIALNRLEHPLAVDANSQFVGSWKTPNSFVTTS